MLARFQHVLVPVDFTTKNHAALEIAFDIAGRNRAKTTLLHVIESIEDLSDDDIREFYEHLESRAQVELESLAQRFAEAGLEVEWKIRYGKRVREIVQDAVDRSIDLIVMSSHPIDASKPMESFSTLSYQTSVLCQCPVLLVK